MEGRSFDVLVFAETIPALLPYLMVTLLVGLASIAGGSLFGALLAWARLSKNRAAARIAEFYVYIIRCTPSIVLLFLVFYGAPKIAEDVFSIDIEDASRAAYVIATFILLFGGYISEVFRPAYLAVNRGQYEAAVMAGLSPRQAVFLVVLPQAAVIAFPNFGNAVINLLKESALAYTIGLIDLLGKANLMISKNYGGHGMEIYLAAFVIYWLLSIVLGRVFIFGEAYLAKGRGGTAYGA